MKAAIIAPTGLLHRYAARGNYHLCLAHLVNEDEDYANFYHAVGTRGDHVILDNSVVELGRPVDYDELAHAARRVRPSEIVLPDWPKDPGQTYTAARRMAPKFAKEFPGVGIMVVPQGDTVNTWFISHTALLTLDEVTSVGIGKYLGEIRPKVVKELNNGRDTDRDYHLLGTWGNPLEVRHVSVGSPWVRGVDTKLPVRLGQRGIILHPDQGMLTSVRPEPLDFADFRDPLPVVTEHNVRVFKDWALGQTTADVLAFKGVTV